MVSLSSPCPTSCSSKTPPPPTARDISAMLCSVVVDSHDAQPRSEFLVTWALLKTQNPEAHLPTFPTTSLQHIRPARSPSNSRETTDYNNPVAQSRDLQFPPTQFQHSRSCNPPRPGLDQRFLHEAKKSLEQAAPAKSPATPHAVLRCA